MQTRQIRSYRMTSSGLVAEMGMEIMVCEHKFNKHSIKELLRMQSKGQYLTPDEKKRVLSEAELRRKQKAN